MKWLWMVLVCIGCGNGDCVVADAVVVSGRGAVAYVLWTEPSAPTITNSVSFEIVFGDGSVGVECNRIPWTAVSHGVTVDVSEDCVAIDLDGQTTQLATALLSVTSTLDSLNEGTLTLRFDVPKQDVTLVEIDALVVDVTFTHAGCSQGSSWGFWDI